VSVWAWLSAARTARVPTGPDGRVVRLPASMLRSRTFHSLTGDTTRSVAVMFARVIRVWLHDDDPGLGRTMAELDRDLATGARFAMLLDDLCRLAPRCPPRRRRTRDSGHRAPDPSERETMRT